MSADLVIRGARLVTPAGVRAADLAVAEGVIAEIGESLEGPGEVIDAQGLHVFPGVIDAHVHFNEPGRTDWEGIATGTRALAAGGATCGFDMPLNSSPPVLDGASFDLKAEAVTRSAHVDLALWGGLVPGPLGRLDELADRGVIGFKAFMSGSGIDEFPRADDEVLHAGMERAAALGLPVAVHAESEELTARLAAAAVAAGKVGVRDYLDSRPAAAELDAIARAVELAAATGCRLHVVHVSTGRGVALVAEARARGVDVSCETCPHYLLLTDEDAERLGAIAKCAPPLRGVDDAGELWRELLAGTVDTVGSDHSPCAPALKEGDAFAAWGGISGCQTTLAALVSEGHRGLSPTHIATLTSGAVAARFGLRGRGRIDVGADADLALVDLDAEWVVTPDALEYRHRHSPYVGRTLRGRLVRTLLRGTTVAVDGAATGPRTGRLIRRQSRS